MQFNKIVHNKKNLRKEKTMKRFTSLNIIILMLITGVIRPQTVTLEFHSDGEDQSGFYYHQVDPYIVMDEANNNFGLVFTQLGYLDFFFPSVRYWQAGDPWNNQYSDDINPYSDEVLDSRLHIIQGTNQVLILRGDDDFTPQNVNDIVGTWTSSYKVGDGNWTLERYESFTRANTSYRDYTSGSNEVHFLTRELTANGERLKYYKRTASGSYSPDGYDVDNNTSVLFDLTVGDNNTAYFCYIIGSNIKVRKYQENPISIATITQIFTPWNSKLQKMVPPTIAYNSLSGKTMLVFSDYDTNTQLWSLYYSESSDQGATWSSAEKVYENTRVATYPHLSADKNSGDFFLSFLSFDDSNISNHIYLQVIGYSEVEGGFGSQPLEIADLGELDNGSGLGYRNRPIHSAVIPYESSTQLLVSSVYFPSDNYEVDVRLYRVEFPNTVTYTFRNLIVDEDPGGQFTLTNKVTNTQETFVSGSQRNLNLDDEYNIETLERRFDDYNYQGTVKDYQHHHWDEDNSRFKLADDFTPSSFETGKDAKYISLASITLESIGSIQIRDPWYYDETLDEQPDDFYLYTDVSNPDGSYEVFLNQDPQQQDVYYSLRAPLLINEGNSVYQVFHRWLAMKANGDTLSPTGIFENEQSRETRVVFTDSVATVEAEYFNVTLIGEGVNLSESSGNLILHAPEYIVINVIDVEIFDSWTISPQGGATIT